MKKLLFLIMILFLTPIVVANNQTISDLVNQSVIVVRGEEVVQVLEEPVVTLENETLNESERVLELIGENGFLPGFVNDQNMALFAVLLLIIAIFIYTNFSVSYLIAKADRLHKKANRLDDKGKFLKATALRKKADKILDKTWK